MCTDRYRVVHEIIHPLLACLAGCYQVIDTLPQADFTRELKKGDRERKSNPPPPQGMLSIQNYTDIAAMIEFLVCTSILPNLEENVLMSVNDRARYFLPKSLAGRLSRYSLLWGTATVEIHIGDDCRLSELRSTLTSIGRVVLLDRFRPMIMPRHLTDLFAALLQTQQLQNKKQLQSPSSLSSSLSLDYKAVCKSLCSGPTSKVDSLSHANTYQALLLRGMKAPSWLRKRVSKLLTDLALQDLAVIVHVFVHSASSSQEDMTGASLRLAKALIIGDHTEIYFKRLADQLITLLDADGLLESVVANPDVAARALTVWAVLDQLSTQQLVTYILPILSKNFFACKSAEFSLHQGVRRIVVLLSIQPSTLDGSEVLALFLSAIPFGSNGSNGSKITIFGQLIRVATITKIIGFQAKNDATLALRLLLASMSITTFKFNGQQVAGSDLFALAIVHAIEPSCWDMEGQDYIVSVASKPRAFLDHVLIGTRGHDVIETIGERAKFVVAELLAPLSGPADSDLDSKNSVDSNVQSDILSALFHALLIIYFSIGEDESNDPTHLRCLQTTGNPQLSAMILLPLIGEQCSIDSLLLGGTNGKGLLCTMSLILESANKSHDVGITDALLPRKFSDRFKTSDELLCIFLGISANARPVIREDVHGLTKEATLLSTVSVVLSLLVAMLELGAPHREVDEEIMLKEMLPSLEPLSMFAPQSHSDDADFSKCRAEVAEMASHAMALISCRSVSGRESSGPEKEHAKSFSDFIKEVEDDLQSDQPPIRAKGVVTLRHLARGYLKENDSTNSLIVEVGGDRDHVDPDVIAQILRVSILALADQESYVYLAAIQTIVATADVRPRLVLPLLVAGMSTGVIALVNSSDIMLTSNQRVKVGEAVLFTIRRRGNAIYELSEKLLDFLLFGNQLKGDGSESGKNVVLVQEQTHQYFLGDSTDSMDEVIRKVNMDEKNIRVNSGGPVFNVEEDDLVRGTCIAVLADLVCAAPTTVTSRYCAIFVRLVQNALQLKASRPVRRSAALLCSAIYKSVIREVGEVLETEHMHPSIADCSFLVCLVRSDEASLKATIERCIDGTDAMLLAQVHDPATVARCQEALAIRAEAEELGLFAAAMICISSEERDHHDPIVHIINSRLGEKKDFNPMVTLMKGLKVDPNDLSLR